MKATHGMQIVRADRLVSVWKDQSGKIFRQGKRVPLNYPLSQDVRHAYAKSGLVSGVKCLMKEKPHLNLRQAAAEINANL